MNYIFMLEKIFQSQPIYTKEQIMSFDAKFQIKATALPKRSIIYDFINKIPNRDNIMIILNSSSGISYYFKKDHLGNLLKYDEFFQSVNNDSMIEVQIKIKKQIIDNRLSVYSYQLFMNELFGVPVLKQLNYFQDLFSLSDFLIFEVFDQKVSFNTETIAFTSFDKSLDYLCLNRRKQLDRCSLASGFYNMSEYQLLPDDFHIISGEANEHIVKSFEKLRSILSFLYIASASTISSGKMELQINGQRRVFNLEQVSNNLTAYQIYRWIYFDGNLIDKAAIARNTLSLYCKNLDVLSIDNSFMAEIQSSFNLYLKEHVERYLELKKEIVAHNYEISEKFGIYITELSNRFMKNLTAVAAFVFTIVLTNAVAQGIPEKIFTRDVTIILELVLFGSFIYLVLTRHELNIKVDLVGAGIKRLEENYHDVISRFDVNLLNDALNSAKMKLHKARRNWTIGWLTGIVICFIFLTYISQDPFPIFYHIIKPMFFGN